MAEGALPLLAFGQFTPEYFSQGEGKGGVRLHLGANTPAGGVRTFRGRGQLAGAGKPWPARAGRLGMTDLDDTDRAILRALATDATRGAGEIGRALGLSQPAAWRRIRALEAAGVLAGRRVEVDLPALGFGVSVFLGVKLATKGRVSLADFERAVTAIPEVLTVQHVLGVYDYRLRVTARDLPDFERVLRRRILTLPGVGQVDANVLLSEERRTGPLG